MAPTVSSRYYTRSKSLSSSKRKPTVGWKDNDHDGHPSNALPPPKPAPKKKRETGRSTKSPTKPTVSGSSSPAKKEEFPPHKQPTAAPGSPTGSTNSPPQKDPLKLLSSICETNAAELSTARAVADPSNSKAEQSGKNGCRKCEHDSSVRGGESSSLAGAGMIPQLPPEGFKSPYMLFFMAKKDEICKAHGPNTPFAESARAVAELWQNLPADGQERKYWEAQAQLGAKRSSSNQVPACRVKAKKDLSAPKKPMSAFMHYSQDKRKVIQAENPSMKYFEVTRILGKMWRSEDKDIKQQHYDWESAERIKYDRIMAEHKRVSMEAELDGCDEGIPTIEAGKYPGKRTNPDSPVFSSSKCYEERERKRTKLSGGENRTMQHVDLVPKPAMEVSSGNDRLALLSSICEQDRATSPPGGDDDMLMCSEELVPINGDVDYLDGSCDGRNVFHLHKGISCTRAPVVHFARRPFHPVSPLRYDFYRPPPEHTFSSGPGAIWPDNRLRILIEGSKAAEENFRRCEAARNVSVTSSSASTSSSLPVSVASAPPMTPPKKAKSAYIFFFNAKKEEVREMLPPNAKFTEHAKAVAELWRSLPMNGPERKHFEELAKLDKMRFKNETKAYKQGQEDDKERAQTVMPKKPMSAFLRFSQENRKVVQSQNPGLNHCDITKLLSKMWKQADAATKKRHRDREFNERLMYNQAMAEWKEMCEKKSAAERKVALEAATATIAASIKANTDMRKREAPSPSRAADLICAETELNLGGRGNAGVRSLGKPLVA